MLVQLYIAIAKSRSILPGNADIALSLVQAFSVSVYTRLVK